MNHYGQLALDHSRRHRPRAYSETQDPIRFYGEAGEAIQAEVTRLRDEILGPRCPAKQPRATAAAATRRWPRPRS